MPQTAIVRHYKADLRSTKLSLEDATDRTNHSLIWKANFIPVGKTLEEELNNGMLYTYHYKFSLRKFKNDNKFYILQYFLKIL